MRLDAASFRSWSSPDGSLFLAFDGSLRASTGLDVTFRPALDGQSVFISELDVEISLVDTRKFALKRVSLLGLFQIEARCELLPSLSAGFLNLIEGVVKEAEERSELMADWPASHRGVGNSWEEERHVPDC